MPGFVVTAVFVLDGGPGGGKAPLGPDVLAANLRPGHRFSYCDGRTLSVVLELVALHDAVAFETALGRIERAWAAAGGGELAAPTTLRLQRAVPLERVSAGAPGRSAQRRAAKAIRRTVRTVGFLDADGSWVWQSSSRGWGGPDDDGPDDDGPDDGGPDDDGGLAGVREPRRPGPGPGHLFSERPLPGPGPR